MRRFEKILIPVDLGQESSWQEALPTGVDQAQHSGGELHIVTVVPEEPPQLAWLPDDYSSKMIAYANEQLAKLVGSMIPEQMSAQQHVRQGTIYSEIVKLAKEIDADLIVMASHRPELKDFLLGPNAARVVRHAECPVLVIR
jgi:nucleotide-binding universal stress UspA family protein